MKESNKRKIQRFLLKLRAPVINKSTPFLNMNETVDYIIENNASIARYGDGEYALIDGKSIGFQEVDLGLTRRLIEVLKNPVPGLLIALPSFITIGSKRWKQIVKHNVRGYTIDYWTRNVYRNYHVYKDHSSSLELIGDSLMSRFYMSYVYDDTSELDEYTEKLKRLWHDKNIVFVEGNYSRLGVGNDFFDNAKSIKRIICPNKNAFSKYEEILSKTLENITKDTLVITSLGPTATVLTYDLAKEGYRVLDLGHIDLEYIWFKEKATYKRAIKGRDVNELPNNKGYVKKDTLKDEKYKSEIILTIK